MHFVAEVIKRPDTVVAMRRREFLKKAGCLATVLSVAGIWCHKEATCSDDFSPGLPRRRLGRTDLQVSIVAFPGLALTRYSQQEANQEVQAVLDEGINHFDVAPAYGDAEVKLGIALQGIPRDRYILSCKTRRRDAAGAQQELEHSLLRLKTDYFDLYQLHSLRRLEEVEQAFGPGGAMEAILKAKEEGKVRYLGFSAHTVEAALAAMHRFDFDSVMFPINFIEIYRIGFGLQVLEMARNKGIGVIAIKPIAAGAWLPGEARKRPHWYPSLEEEDEIELAVKYTLSLAPVANVIPTSFFDLCHKCIQAARRYRPIRSEEVQRLQQIAEKRLSLFAGEELALVKNEDWPVHVESPHGIA